MKKLGTAPFVPLYNSADMNEKWGAVTGATKRGQNQPRSPLFAKEA